MPAPFQLASGARMQPAPEDVGRKSSSGSWRKNFRLITAVARGQIGVRPSLRQASGCATKSPAREEVRRASIMTGSLGGGVLPVGPKRLGRRVNRFGSSRGNAATQQIQAHISMFPTSNVKRRKGRADPALRPSLWIGLEPGCRTDRRQPLADKRFRKASDS